MKSRINTLILIVLFIFCAQTFGQNKPAPANIRPLLKGLNLNSNRVPTEEELMAAGQLGGPLHATEDTRKHPNWKIQNRDFGEAIELWNKHEYKQAVTRFREHIKKHPNSAWTAEAELHIGCDATYNGRYNEAEEMFKTILSQHSRSRHAGARELVVKAKMRLAQLKVLQNDFKGAKNYFGDLKRSGTDWRSRTYAANWLHHIHLIEADKLAMLKCGTQALAAIMEKDGNAAQARQLLQLKPESLKGYSMLDLQSIAADYGYTFAARKIKITDLAEIPLPAILQISSRSTGASGHYWVLEKVTKNGVELFDPQAERRFHQKPVELAAQWDGAILVRQKSKQPLPGIALNKTSLEQLFGGCCGTHRPLGPLGNPCNNGAGGGGSPRSGSGPKGSPCPDCGAPTWRVNMLNMNLYISDTPMWYQPAIGPSVSISLHYNSQSAIANYEPFGNKWQSDYATYLVKDSSGTVTLFMPDGRCDVFTPNGQGGYNRPYKVYNTLTSLAENHYELRFPDDTVFVYNIPAGTSSQQPFLVQIRNAHNQSLTFGYNSNVQLTTITDATGKVTNLSYNVQGLVQSVTDPFSRQALFTYDANKNLTKITDMAGYWTEFTYNTDTYLTSLKNAKGTTQFYIEVSDNSGANSDNYPPPGDLMWANYRITVTYPDNAKEEFFYYGGGYYSWHVEPKFYIPWQSWFINNFRINNPKTFYYYTKMADGQHGEISRITYPDNSFVQYGYDLVNGNRTSAIDEFNLTTLYSYNTMSLVTGVTNPQGQATTYTYAPNNVDLIRVQNSLGSTVMTYNDKHQVTSVTDAQNRTSTFVYNSHGQIVSTTDAANILTEYLYDTNYFLQQIKHDNKVVSQFIRDPIGRAIGTNDANGTTMVYEYNNLDQVKKIIYPDNKYVFYTYTACCPWTIESVTDRNGRITYYEYDSRKNLISVTGSGTAGTRFVYDANRNMTQLIDANNNVTRFEYDGNNRLTRKIFSDNTGIDYKYDTGGRLTQRIDARNITTNYLYDPYSNLTNISYSDSTPAITYQYDNFNRLTNMIDGVGTTQYTYDNLSRVLNVDGPWVNDTLTYGYDTLDRMSGVTPQMGQVVSYGYDNLNRLTNITAGTDNFTYAYKTDTANLVQTLTRPNNGYTSYDYDNLNRLLGIANKNSGNNVITGNTFIYDANNDLIGSETATNNDALSGFQQGLKTYDYNNLNQLLQITSNPQPPAPSPFSFDANGNMTRGYTRYEFTAAYDAENRLKSIQYTDSGTSVVHRIEYVYGASGFVGIIKKYENSTLVKETRMVRDGFLELQERDQNNAITREYVWGMNLGGGIGGLLSMRQQGQNYHYLYDGKGNVSAVLDSAQQIVASYRYDTFGKVMAKSGTLDQPFQFSTKYYDQQTGLNYYGYRFYSPALGRWINRDPLGEEGGINLYAFVENDPTNRIDYLGLNPGGSQPPGMFEPPRPPYNPPGWTPEWRWEPSTSDKYPGWEWWDPQGGDWHYDPDIYGAHPEFPNGHYDYRPNDHASSPKTRVPPGDKVPKPRGPRPRGGGNTAGQAAAAFATGYAIGTEISKMPLPGTNMNFTDWWTNYWWNLFHKKPCP